MSFMAGAYLMVHNGKVCGQSADGIGFDRTVFKRMITGDWFGDAPQDGIYRGMEVTSMVTFLEADAAAMRDILYPYQGAAAVTSLAGGLAGLLDVKHGIARPLILTSLITAALINANGVSGGVSITPLTRTLPRTVLAEGYPIREMLNSNLRDVPVKLRHYPSQWNQTITGSVTSLTMGGEFGTET